MEQFRLRLILVGFMASVLSRHHVFCHEETAKKPAAVKLPNLGVGILDIKTADEKENALVMALNAGYRMIDIWEGDEIVLKNAIVKTKVQREEIFIVVKLYPPETVQELYNTGDAVAGILERLQTTYIDLLLMNYPDYNNQHIQRWKAMISLKNRNEVKLIGVANFNYEQIMSLAKATAVLPSVVQLEINPFFQQKDLVQKLTSNGIAIQAYSPLANAQKLNDERLIKIAKIYDATTAQLLIQWCIQKGYSCVTKSTNKMHLDENINLGEFFIEDIDMKDLDSLEEGFVTNYDPNDPRFYEKSYYQAKETEMKAKKGRLGDDLDEEEKKDEPYYFDDDGENGQIGGVNDTVPLSTGSERLDAKGDQDNVVEIKTDEKTSDAVEEDYKTSHSAEEGGRKRDEF